MARAAIEGAADGGATCSTSGWSAPRWSTSPVGELGLDGGIMVTASHNPKEYTGMKIVRRGALPVGGDSGCSTCATARRRGRGAQRGEVARRTSGRLRRQVLSFVDVDAIGRCRS
jgi:phosphomannomutase/phosphomannomutase/phosphoglucomutase